MPAAVDSGARASALLSSKVAKTAFVHTDTGDTVVEFDAGCRLEVLATSSGYACLRSRNARFSSLLLALVRLLALHCWHAAAQLRLIVGATMQSHARIVFWLLALFPALSMAVVPEPAPFRAVIVEAGTFRIMGPMTDVPAPNTAAGKVSEFEESQLLEATDRLKAKLGISFGIRYRLIGVRDGEIAGLEMRTLHPPMRAAGGQPQTRSTAPAVVFGERGVAEGEIIYILSEPHEVLQGRWTVQLLYKGSVVLSKDFTLE